MAEQLPDSSVNRFDYGIVGAITGYTDPTSQATRVERDLIDRPMKRVYPDGTVETFTYEGQRIKTFTDRQNRTQVFGYNAKGQLEAITQPGGGKLDELQYDAAGRLVRWTNQNAEIRYEDFNLDGKAGRTVQRRYKNATGLTAKDVLDEFVQEHEWNAHGERVRWTMPAYAGFNPSGTWTREVRETPDAMGNIAQVDRTFTDGASQPMLVSQYRSTGRPAFRNLFTACNTDGCTPVLIERAYSYDPAHGLLMGLAASARGQLVAGSKVTALDGVQKAEVQLLGISQGERSNAYGYDDRGRLRTAVLARRKDTQQIIEHLTPADFRSGSERPSSLSESVRAALKARGIDPETIDPPSMSAIEADAGHKIKTLVEGSATRQRDGAAPRVARQEAA